LFCVGTKKKVARETKPDEKKKKTKKLSASPLSSASDETNDDGVPTSPQGCGGGKTSNQQVLGEIVGVHKTDDDMSTVSCHEKVRQKKNKTKSMAKIGADIGKKENLTSDVTEKVSDGFTPWRTFTPSDENDLEKQEAKKKKKKKNEKSVSKKGADIDGKENLGSNLPEKVSEGFKSCEENGSEKQKKTKKRKKVDSDGTEEKPKKPKMKKPKLHLQENQKQIRPSSEEDLISESKLKSLCSPVPHKHHGSCKPDISKPKKPKFGVGTEASTKDGSFVQSSQSGRSSPAVSGSPQSVPSVSGKSGKGGPLKPKKPKFGVTPSYSTGSSSQSSNSCSPHLAASKDTRGGKGVSPKPKKFGVHDGKSAGQPLSDLAEELGEIMKQTEREGSAAEKIQIPTVKAKKFVPVFSKTSQKV